MPKVVKLDMTQVKECFSSLSKEDQFSQIQSLQIALYVMCGGGLIGRLFAEQPLDAYIDDRAGKLPYTRKQIYAARDCLIALAKTAGFNPVDLPRIPHFHHCGVF